MKKYRRNPLVIYNDNEKKKQIYHPGSGNFHELNGVAFLIWDKLQDWITQQEITEAIVMNFKDTPSNVVEQDVSRFLTSLEDRDLVETVKM